MVTQKELLETLLGKFSKAKKIGLNHNDLAVYEIYNTLYELNNESIMSVNPSQREVAELSGLDHSTVKRIVKKLKSKNILIDSETSFPFEVVNIFE